MGDTNIARLPSVGGIALRWTFVEILSEQRFDGPRFSYRANEPQAYAIFAVSLCIHSEESVANRLPQ